MINYKQYPESVRWVLHLLDGDPLSNSEYCGTVTQHDADFYHGQYAREGHYGTECSDVENDEIIAHALQEELSQLAVAEASGSSHAGEEHLQASTIAQDWVAPSMRNFSSGHETSQVEADDMGLSSSCSSPREKSYSGEDWSYPLELTDESDLDWEVGKRLNQMVPVPHVPRINGEIPSVDEAISDHQRLLDRLQLYGLVELKVQGDGNCQFGALSDQFYRSPEHHKFVRQQVVNQLKCHPEIYEGYVSMAYRDYLKKMSKTGEWGDHVTLQAAADSYGVKIFVITSFKDTCYMEILPNIQKSKRNCIIFDKDNGIKFTEKVSCAVIFLSFWAEVHYNSIYPEGGMLYPFHKGFENGENRPYLPLLRDKESDIPTFEIKN
ncbi:hypothetical protein HHK36_018173 [Tetracentron sinense]|uniref:ubiquitinyl hydrolase 1 n=1 Tax=Tetracentron sinense TaxID=13715 RepID=A0A834YVE7_TETSI|nr:hypothetical protein HHK36_018173 [Tetracentron sinense]